MANALYDPARQSFLCGSFGWLTANFKVALLTSSYTFDPSHQYLSQISGGYIVAQSGNLANKTATAGVANADPITLSAVTGSTVSYFVIYHDTGSSSTSDLIAYFDTATNLPLTPNGGDIILQWDSGANHIFKL